MLQSSGSPGVHGRTCAVGSLAHGTGVSVAATGKALLLTMPEQKNQPCLVDPRQLLARLLARFAKRGLAPMVAVELEFYLMDRKRGALGEPLPPISPATGEPDSSGSPRASDRPPGSRSSPVTSRK